jgi:voltage-gated potassium channel
VEDRIMAENVDRPRRGWQNRLHTVVFEADTFAGWAFDVALIICILASVATVMLESVPAVRARHQVALDAWEWGFTILFTVEYLLRLLAVRRPLSYVTSFYGVIDLLAILPTYLSLLFPGVESLVTIRVLRLLRVFRIFKLTHYVGESQVLLTALRSSRRKVSVFLVTVLTIVIVVGTLMYLIEGEKNGFTSIPISIYWAVVTITTVGFGDVVPKTPLGQFLSSTLMITGYAIIAIPTGIFTAELSSARKDLTRQACPACSAQGHDLDARFCKFCAAQLHE